MKITQKSKRELPMRRVLLRILQLFMAVIIIAVTLSFNNQFLKPVKAIETDTFTNYMNQSVDTMWKGLRANDPVYHTACHLDTAQSGVFAFTASVGYDSVDKWVLWETQAGFSLAGLPSDAEAVAMRFKGKIHAKTEHPVWGDNLWTSWWASLEMNGSTTLADFDNAIDAYQPKDRLSWAVLSSSYEVGYTVTWNINPDNFEYMLTPTVQNKVWVMFTSEYQMLDWQPLGTSVGSMSTTLRAGYNDGNDVRLEIDYISPASPYGQTFHTNAAIDTSVLGDEVADNITWNSPRLLYSDQFPELKVNGDSGAPVSLDLLDVSGKVMASITDSIRVDDIYAWKIENVPSTYRGYLRVRENNFNLMSQWGYIASSPDDSQPTGRVLAVSTVYPQYDREFSSYVVNRGGFMIVHWRCNISWANAADYSLRIWVRGSGEVYIATLDEFADEYLGSLDNQAINFHHRYALFTPAIQSGQSDYSGLINNLNISFTSSNKGFLQAVIYHDSLEVENTKTHSAHWYLTNASEGITLSTQYSNYGVNNDLSFKGVIGKECNVEYDLGAVKIAVYDDSNDDLIATHYLNAVEGNNYWIVSGLKYEGSYYALIEFYSDSKTYSYIKRINFTVSGTESTKPPDEEDWIKKFLNWLEEKGLDTAQGHWLIVLAAMVIAFVMFHQSSLLRVVVPMLIMGVAIIFGWLDLWVIALLALGAGLTVYGLFRKKVQGGED